MRKKFENKILIKQDEINPIFERLKREISEVKYILQYVNSRRYDEYEIHRRRMKYP